MSEEELQNEEGNNEENNEEENQENNEEENAEKNDNDEMNPGGGDDGENEEQQEQEQQEKEQEQEQEQEQQEQEQKQEQEQENVEVENDNKEEEKEKEDVNENNNAENLNEQNDNNILKETEENDIKNEINALNNNNINNINNNIEQEMNIIDNNKETVLNNDNNIINLNQENVEDNKELTILTKKFTAENLLSFGKNDYLGENTINTNTNGFGYNEKKSTQQILNEINNEMDLLEKNLNPIFNKYQIKKNLYNDNKSYDEQDLEIKKLIEKANKLVNKHSYNTYGTKSEYNGMRNKYYNTNNISENGGNISNYSERNDDSSSYENNTNNSYKDYIRNISPEKDINKHRIKNISNIYHYNNNHRNYKKERPLIYRQSESIPIKNSYMNKLSGQPQTYKKTHFSNNLVFSSDKISYRNINHNGNINQSIDILFNSQK
jgi:hypothetical protein